MEIKITPPEAGETEKRIVRHISIAKNEEQKRDICLTWDGYIAALLEWGLISVNEHASAHDLIKGSLKQGDPSSVIFLGTEDN